MHNKIWESNIRWWWWKNQWPTVVVTTKNKKIVHEISIWNRFWSAFAFTSDVFFCVKLTTVRILAGGKKWRFFAINFGFFLLSSPIFQSTHPRLYLIIFNYVHQENNQSNAYQLICYDINISYLIELHKWNAARVFLF